MGCISRESALVELTAVRLRLSRVRSTELTSTPRTDIRLAAHKSRMRRGLHPMTRREDKTDGLVQLTLLEKRERGTPLGVLESLISEWLRLFHYMGGINRDLVLDVFHLQLTDLEQKVNNLLTAVSDTSDVLDRVAVSLHPTHLAT